MHEQCVVDGKRVLEWPVCSDPVGFHLFPKTLDYVESMVLGVRTAATRILV